MSQQDKWMRDHNEWNNKVRELESKIQQANSQGKDGQRMYGNQLKNAQKQSKLCYELATDRGY